MRLKPGIKRQAIVGLWLTVSLLGLARGDLRAAALTLPFANRGGDTTNQMTNYAASAQPVSAMTSAGTRFYRGAFSASSTNSRLAIQSDDGSDVYVNGVKIVPRKGDGTHWEDLGSSLNILDYTFTNTVEYCIEVDYQNNAYTQGDTDGVSLYAFNGGGSVRDGIAVWGPAQICIGGSITLNACGSGTINWTSSAPSIASVSGSGATMTVQGLAPGTATITATDSDGKTGSRTVKVVRLWIEPSYFVTCEGATNNLVITNADVTGGVTWNPTGIPSANTRTNTYILSTAGTNPITAYWNGCTALATAIVVQVASLVAGGNNFCGSGSATLTVTTTPPGFESYVSWAGEGLTPINASQVIAGYSTPGVRTVTASCGSSSRSVTLTVHKVDITNTTQHALAGSTVPVNYYLSSDSVGPFTWTVTPSGGPSVSGSGLSASGLPGNTPGTYTIRAYATALQSCQDTSTLEVVQVTFSSNHVALCEGGTGSVTVTVNPPSALSLLTFDTVTNASAGGANTHAHLGVTGTNVTIYGDVAGTAYLRVKLGPSTVIGLTLQIVRVTFPPEAWYVGVGKSVDFTNTIVPAGATVTYDTASNAIATAVSIPGGVRVTGLAPGITQVRAKVGGGSVCSTKDVTAVSVVFPTNALTICNLNTAFVAVAVAPPGAPVTFSSTDASVVQVTAQGTNITIAPLKNGKATIKAKIGSEELASMLVISGTIGFPSNDWFALRGTPQEFAFTNSPELSGSPITITVSDLSIATVTAGSPSHLIVTGLSNGTTQITASLEPDLVCVAKSVTIFSAELKRIEFTSDHNLICNGTHLTNAGVRFPNVEWDPGASPPVNAPMTHTAGATNKVFATVRLAIAGLPNGTVISALGRANPTEPALDFGGTNSIPSAGTWDVSASGLFPLGKEIREINAAIRWTLSVAENDFELGNSGPHAIFTTLGTPIITAPSSASVPNVPRMRRATVRVAPPAAADAGSNCYPRIVYQVMQSAGQYALVGVSMQDAEAWLFPELAPRDCLSIARFVRNICMVEGVPGTFASQTYAGLYKTTDAYRQSDETPYAGHNPLIGTNRPLTGREGDLCYPGPVTKDCCGPTVTTGVATNWVLRLADGGCVNQLNPAAPPGTVGCGPNGINCFEAALVYTEAGGSKTWYMAAGTTGVWFENNIIPSPNQDRHGRDQVLRVFVSLVWCAWEDPPGSQPLGMYVKKVEHVYTPGASDPLCP